MPVSYFSRIMLSALRVSQKPLHPVSLQALLSDESYDKEIKDALLRVLESLTDKARRSREQPFSPQLTTHTSYA